MNACYQYYGLPLLEGARKVDFCSDRHFRQVYQAWASKLNLQYRLQCPECGDSTDVLIGDATCESIQAAYYSGQPIYMAPDTGEQHSRPHTKAQRALFAEPSARKLLSRFAMYVRGDHRTAFGHASTAEAFVFEDGHADTV